MQNLREFGNALIVAFLSIGLTLGALSISLVEFIPEEAPAPTLTRIPSPFPITATHTLPPSATLLPGAASPTPTATFTVIATAQCNAPQGWLQILVQPGETLDSLATRYGISRDSLKTGNCLISDIILPGTYLSAPAVTTNTPVFCNKGAVGWSPSYKVIKGDTLYSIALRYYTTLTLLKNVNCLASDQIQAGEILWVPNVATRTVTFTSIPGIVLTYTSVPTLPLTETALPFTLTPIPSDTPVPTATATVTPIPTQTASPTAFPTNTP
jgi:LysM repeat protein